MQTSTIWLYLPTSMPFLEIKGCLGDFSGALTLEKGPRGYLETAYIHVLGMTVSVNNTFLGPRNKYPDTWPLCLQVIVRPAWERIGITCMAQWAVELSNSHEGLFACIFSAEQRVAFAVKNGHMVVSEEFFEWIPLDYLRYYKSIEMDQLRLLDPDNGLPESLAKLFEAN